MTSEKITIIIKEDGKIIIKEDEQEQRKQIQQLAHWTNYQQREQEQEKIILNEKRKYLSDWEDRIRTWEGKIKSNENKRRKTTKKVLEEKMEKMEQKMNNLIKENNALRETMGINKSEYNESINSNSNSSNNDEQNKEKEFYKETAKQLVEILVDRIKFNPTQEEQSIIERYGIESEPEQMISMMIFFTKNKSLNMLTKEQIKEMDLQLINLPPHQKPIPELID